MTPDHTLWTATDTPLGTFTIIADDDAVLASGWTQDVAAMSEQILHALRGQQPVRHRGQSRFADAVDAYFAGDLHAIDAVAVRHVGPPFRTAAWGALRKVAPGEVISYSELARRAGRPSAIRAAASACARNPSALFVPCHRVRRLDGSVGGFAYGVQTKNWLLAHEAAA